MSQAMTCAGCHNALPFNEHKALQDSIIISFSRKRDWDVVDKWPIEDGRVQYSLMPSVPVPWLCSHVRQSKVTLKASLLSDLARPKLHHASNHLNPSWQVWLTLPSLQGYPVCFLSTDPWLCHCPRAGPCHLSPHYYSPLLTASRHAIYSVQRTHVALLLKPSWFPIMPREDPKLSTQLTMSEWHIISRATSDPESYSPALPR